VTELEQRATPRFPHSGAYSSGESRYLTGTGSVALRAAVARLYEAFSDARLSDPLAACSHCFMPSDVLYVAATPLRSFSHADLSLVSSKLTSTLGCPEDVAYFVPRIVEAIAEGAHIELSPFASRLGKMPARDWRPERREALLECFELLFTQAEGAWCDLSDSENQQALRAACAGST
jgi:hypothetical protein